jgi:hypothetical protein
LQVSYHIPRIAGYAPASSRATASKSNLNRHNTRKKRAPRQTHADRARLAGERLESPVFLSIFAVSGLSVWHTGLWQPARKLPAGQDWDKVDTVFGHPRALSRRIRVRRLDRIRMAGWLVLLALLLAAGCSVENLDGVTLVAPVIVPTSTPQPTATPDPLALELPNLIEKEFMGTLLTFRYPDGWTTDEGGQYMNVYSTDPDTPVGVGVFISLTRGVGLDSDSEEALAPLAMQVFLQNAVDHGFANPETVPAEGEALALTGARTTRRLRMADRDGATPASDRAHGQQARPLRAVHHPGSQRAVVRIGADLQGNPGFGDVGRRGAPGRRRAGRLRRPLIIPTHPKSPGRYVAGRGFRFKEVAPGCPRRAAPAC